MSYVICNFKSGKPKPMFIYKPKSIFAHEQDKYSWTYDLSHALILDTRDEAEKLFRGLGLDQVQKVDFGSDHIWPYEYCQQLNIACQVMNS